MHGQQSQTPSQVNPDRIGEAKLHVKVSYRHIFLEPAPGVRADLIVYDQDLAQLKKLLDPRLRERFDEATKNLQELERQSGEALKTEPRATQFKEKLNKRKQELVTAFEALRLRSLATAADRDETFSVATSWPPLWTKIDANISREQANEGKRIVGLFADNQRSQPIDYSKAGRRYVVRDLVLGTVRVSYDPEISPGKPAQLELQFQPHAILSDKVVDRSLSDQVVKWHAKAEYQAQSTGAKYDFQQSGRKPETRTLDLRSNNEETWAWTVSGLKNFKADTSDLIFYLGYDSALGDSPETDVWREKIKWTEKNEQDFAEKAWSWFKANLNWFLGILALVTSIWASVKTIQLRRLELAGNAPSTRRRPRLKSGPGPNRTRSTAVYHPAASMAIKLNGLRLKKDTSSTKLIVWRTREELLRPAWRKTGAILRKPESRRASRGLVDATRGFHIIRRRASSTTFWFRSVLPVEHGAL